MKNLINISDISQDNVDKMIKKAHSYYHNNNLPGEKLRNKILINLFLSPSTRTRVSFEIAAKQLGMHVININSEHSSVVKGETFEDTVYTLNAMNPDLMVIRQAQSRILDEIKHKVQCPIINAGDGNNQHPTQALLDVATILQHKSTIKNLKIVICGDILHSRVIGSNAVLLNNMGANLTFIAPDYLQAHHDFVPKAKRLKLLSEGIKGSDIIIMLRIQKERFDGIALDYDEYVENYQLNQELIKLAKPDVLVMHPGPVNRNLEITDDVLNSKHSIINQQIEMGVAMRKAILEYTLN